MLVVLALDAQTVHGLLAVLGTLSGGLTGWDHLCVLRVGVDVSLGRVELLLEDVHAASGGDETKEGRRWVEGARAELGVGLKTDEVRVVVNLQHLHTLATLVLADEAHMSRGLEAVDVLRLNLVTVTVTLPCNLMPTVETTELGVLSVGLKDGRPQTQPHSTTHVSLGDLRHEADDGVGSVLGQLRGVGT